ncbi:hypothetical protein TNCV_520151 [Trichonephila clavipes]|nr:hypothetical protein TNCV_520151 [Trichonephila clavipes]
MSAGYAPGYCISFGMATDWRQAGRDLRLQRSLFQDDNSYDRQINLWKAIAAYGNGSVDPNLRTCSV